MNPGAGQALLDRIETYVVEPIIAVIFTLGLLMFFVGIVEFLWQIKDGKTEGDGRKHMVWGLVGMLIMVSVYGIINLIINTFDLDDAIDTSRAQNVRPADQFFNPFNAR
ncbi:MAG TPA: hypothetical protein VNM40_00930 [Candidatus Paceibacterota bacterium]|nr:hypothetical protein [Candidatus Paceibacterota bacterium]